MRKAMDEVLTLLKAKIDFIWIDTYEEAEVIKDLTRLVRDNFVGINMHVWSITEGLKKLPMIKGGKQEPADRSLRDPAVLLQHIGNLQNEVTTSREGKRVGTQNHNIFILRDFHQQLQNMALVARSVRDIKEYQSYNYNPIIVVSPSIYVPLELEKMIHIVRYDTLSKEDIQEIINKVQENMARANEIKNIGYILNTEEEKAHITNSLCGLTSREINDTIAISLKKYMTLSESAIMEQKIQLIQKSGVLDYKIPHAKFEEVGGNEPFKAWIEDVEIAMSDEARAFGCIAPKGYLALGLPGTAR